MKKAMLPKIVLSGLLCTLANALPAAEVDHYSIDYQTLEDAAPIVNERANTYLKDALIKANKKGHCNEEQLYEELKYYFANHSKGVLCKELLHDDSIPTVKMSLDQSIYREWTPFNGYLLGRKKARTSPLALGPIMRMGDHVIGTDKLEHMFGMGFIYFNRYYKKQKDLENVLKRGVFYEKTILGGNVIATGIFSYADLSANFNGMRFWNHMLLKQDDVLGSEHNLGPYVACENKQWVAKEKIDFTQYIDKTMDESINCSKVASNLGLKRLTNQIQLIKEENLYQTNSCLSDENDNTWLTDKYDVVIPTDKRKRTIGQWIINQSGHEKVSYFKEFR